MPDDEVADTFQAWFKIKSLKMRATFEVLFALPGLTLLFGLSAKYLPSTITASSKLPIGSPLLAERIAVAVLLLQSVVVLLLFLFIPKVPQLAPSEGENEDLSRRVQNGAEEFADLWGRAWMLWALLYFVLGIGALLRLWFPGLDFSLLTPLKNFMNNVQTVFFVMCFRELRYPTHGKPSPLFPAISFVALLGVCEAVMLIPGIPKSAHDAGVTLSQVFGWVTGCAGGVAIALVAGALESKMLNAPRRMITLLYVYASIQGAFTVVGRDPYPSLIFTSLAFVLKLLMFALMAWFIESGVILFYFRKMMDFDLKTPEERRVFLESRLQTTFPPKAPPPRRSRSHAHR
ncbi:MAG TPA: hypothetical protein VMW75_03715 [Thermoanaerobaculia bacterium]|nr:hypothetical protein [Thermoanaerobaculia bacterium]